MAVRHKSALKAHRQSAARRLHNRELRSTLRTALKALRSALGAKDKTAARSSMSQTVSLIDKMAGKGIIHRNTASRYKSRLARRLAA